MIYPKEISGYFKELLKNDLFKAEIYLEEELIKGYTHDLTKLSVEDNSFNLQYARLQGKIEALRDLSGKRKLITNQSETVSNSVTKRNS